LAVGYACLTIGVKDAALSRCILKNATQDTIIEITKQNLDALEVMMDYNIHHNIQLFRISSDIIPFGSHPVNQVEWWNQCKDLFECIRKKIIQGNIRVSMHPGQYTVLNSLQQNVIENAVRDLVYHDKVLEALGMDQSCKIILHIGGVYGDKNKAMDTFARQYEKLPRTIKDRLIIENDDKNFTISEVLEVSKKIGAPVVFDNLHHAINPPEEQRPDCEWIKECKKTWNSTDGKQKIHYSQQKENAPAGSHSDMIFYNDFLSFYHRLNEKEIDIMLEVKDKNLSAVKCKNILENARVEELKEEWSRYKYLILSRSPNLYTVINEAFVKSESREEFAPWFYERIEQALELPVNSKAQVTAAECIWDRIYDSCTETERKRYEKLLYSYSKENGTLSSLKNHLFKCVNLRNLQELVDSLYFYLN
jgi:UV DNA damage endonuclease